MASWFIRRRIVRDTFSSLDAISVETLKSDNSVSCESCKHAGCANCKQREAFYRNNFPRGNTNTGKGEGEMTDELIRFFRDKKRRSDEGSSTGSTSQPEVIGSSSKKS